MLSQNWIARQVRDRQAETDRQCEMQMSETDRQQMDRQAARQCVAIGLTACSACGRKASLPVGHKSACRTGLAEHGL